MTQDQYFREFQDEVEQLVRLTKSKNTDYAKASDAYKNFRQIVQLTNDRVSLEDGILTRMSDKMSRLGNLLDHERKNEVGESVVDTLRDLAVYSLIMKIYLQNRWMEEKASAFEVGQNDRIDVPPTPFDLPQRTPPNKARLRKRG